MQADLGGSHQIEGGVETSDVNASEPIEDQSFESPVTKFDLRLDDGEEPIASGTSQPSIQHGRNLLDAKISNYKREKLQRKLPVDAQFLSCAQSK